MSVHADACGKESSDRREIGIVGGGGDTGVAVVGRGGRGGGGGGGSDVAGGGLLATDRLEPTVNFQRGPEEFGRDAGFHFRESIDETIDRSMKTKHCHRSKRVRKTDPKPDRIRTRFKKKNFNLKFPTDDSGTR